MLAITIEAREVYTDGTHEFVSLPEVTLQFEHSLASLSKWESMWEKPFLGNESKTDEEASSYIECMCLTENPPSNLFAVLNAEQISKISKYMEAKMTATWFSENPNTPRSNEIITAEIIYYWMVSLTIPFECQYWHLNRLLALVKTCNNKNNPSKKMSRSEIIRRNRSLNAQRRAQLGSQG